MALQKRHIVKKEETDLAARFSARFNLRTEEKVVTFPNDDVPEFLKRLDEVENNADKTPFIVNA